MSLSSIRLSILGNILCWDQFLRIIHNCLDALNAIAVSILISFLVQLLQVELSDKLPHVQSLCIHEMVVRAFKHILQGVLAAVGDVANMASSVASCLNLLLGTPPTENGDADANSDNELRWKWVETFLLKRFAWQWKNDACNEIRKFAILRGLCHKVS